MTTATQVSELIAAGACVDVLTHDGLTPLHNAAWMGHPEVVEVCLMR